jgi:hypothetical protein
MASHALVSGGLATLVRSARRFSRRSAMAKNASSSDGLSDDIGSGDIKPRRPPVDKTRSLRIAAVCPRGTRQAAGEGSRESTKSWKWASTHLHPAGWAYGSSHRLQCWSRRLRDASRFPPAGRADAKSPLPRITSPVQPAPGELALLESWAAASRGSAGRFSSAGAAQRNTQERHVLLPSRL